MRDVIERARDGWPAVVAAVGLAAVIATATVVPAPAAAPVTVGIEEFRYAPSVVRVPAGTTVQWINHDEELHTVTSATGAFASAGLAHDEAFAQTFRQPGTYQYFCALHPMMKATVVVR
jgi:plastocyanin